VPVAAAERCGDLAQRPVGEFGGEADEGIATGELEPGIDPEDVLLQLSVLWRISPATGGAARAARVLELIVNGLRTRS
jgi:hypothetical protein